MLSYYKSMTTSDLLPASCAAGVDEYFAACRERVPQFTGAHFSFHGTIRIHRSALGADLAIAPLNMLLALPAVLVRLLALTLRRTRWDTASRRLECVPLRFHTAVERSVIRLLAAEVFGFKNTETPFQRTWTSPASTAALGRTQFAQLFGISLRRYAAARSAAAEITTALLAGLVSLLFLDRFSPGSFSAGRALADAVGREVAIREFWLGETAGAWYYSVFTPDTSLPLVIGVILLVMALLSLCAAFAGLIADPVQQALGIHHRRLNRLVESLERAAHARTTKAFDTKDHYVARTTDVIDILRGLWPG